MSSSSSSITIKCKHMFKSCKMQIVYTSLPGNREGNEETEKCNVNKIKQSTTMSTILLVVTLPFARLSQCLSLCSLSMLGNSLGLQWQMSVFYKKNGPERIIYLPTTIDNSSVHPYAVIKYCNKSHCTHQQNDSTVDNNVPDLGVNAMIENQSKKEEKEATTKHCNTYKSLQAQQQQQ